MTDFNEMIAESAAHIAKLEALPDTGFALGWQNGLAVKMVDGKACAIGLAYADHFPTMPRRFWEITNGKGEKARFEPMATAKARAISEQRKLIDMLAGMAA